MVGMTIRPVSANSSDWTDFAPSSNAPLPAIVNLKETVEQCRGANAVGKVFMSLHFEKCASVKLAKWAVGLKDVSFPILKHENHS